MEVSNEVGVDKTFLPTVLLTDARKILTYAQAIALTELIVYLILDFANGPSQLLYPVGILSMIVLNIVWLRYFLYKSPYKRLELFAEAVRKALLDVRTFADPKLARPESFVGDKNRFIPPLI